MKAFKFLLILIVVFSFTGTSFTEVVIPPPPIDIDISNSQFDVLGPSTFRIRNLTSPAYSGVYRVDFQWNPNELIFEPTALSVETGGILIQSVSIIGDEPAGGDNEIDVALHLCPPTFIEVEPGLFIANANLTIQASSISDPFSVSVEECTVTYLKGNDNLDAPTIEDMTIYPNCSIQSGSNECTIPMLDVARKVKFWDDLTTLSPSMIRPVHYIVRYQCEYGNASGTFQVDYDIWLDDWNYC